MAATNTILHRRTFDQLITTASSEGDEVAFAILYAALAAARARLGVEATTKAVGEFMTGATA